MSSSEPTLATSADAGSHHAGSRLAGSGRPVVRGDALGRYLVLERLGVGGMGEVFAAYDPELDRKIAVKLLLPGPADPNASAGPTRLVREAQAMAKLRHRNVVAVHDVGTHDGRVFLAMEFVDGGTLADWMASPRPWPAVIERFAQAGRGLAAAHAAGLIHRDFKPANVLVGRDGQVQVADFGLVRRTIDEPPSREPELRVDAQSESVDLDDTLAVESANPSFTPSNPTGSHASLSLRMTRTGATLGTPAYMALEQYVGGTIDARADQFSFCVALWEALYGERPFAGENLHALMFAINLGAIREPPDERGVPGPIRRAITRGLAKDPAQRWPDMDALLAALAWDPRRRRRRVWAIGISVGLIAATLLVLLQVPERVPAPTPEPLCTGAEAGLGDALSPARRDAIAERFGGFEHTWARDVGDRLFPRLDGWASDWLAAWTDACEATHVRGEQSEDLLDRRMLCLDRRRRDFVGFVEALTQADEDLAKRVDGLFEAIGTVAVCNDSEALLRITPLPADPIAAEAILRTEAAIDDAEAEYLAGRYPQARARLEQTRATVIELDHDPLSAGFEQLSGSLALALDDRVGGEQALEHAFARALAASDDELAVDIARTLAQALSDNDRAKDGLRWLAIATALVERDGSDDETLGLLALARSQALANDGDYPGAELAAQDAYARLQRTKPGSAKVGDALYVLGLAAYRAGRTDEVIERVEQARSAWAIESGPRHPRNVAALNMLGVVARSQGDYASAQRYFEEALAIKVGQLGPDHIEVTDRMMNLSVALADQGKLTEAITLLERTLVIRRNQPVPLASEVGRTQVNLAQMYRQVGRLDDAYAAILDGETLMREAVGDDHPDFATVLNVRASIELARGQLVEADRHVRAAIVVLTSKGGPKHLGLYELTTNVAEIALARAQPREALRLLDRAADLQTENPHDRALREFVRARTLAELGRLAEALPLAQSAKTGFEAVGAKAVGDLAKLDAWLAAHPSPVR